MVEKLLTLREDCRRLGVHPNTLRKWDGQGRIWVVRTVGGRRGIPEGEVERLMGVLRLDFSRKAAVYVRFSSRGQKQRGDLDRQSLLEYVEEKGYEVVAVLKDAARGTQRG